MTFIGWREKARAAVDYVVLTSIERNAPAFIDGNPFVHEILAGLLSESEQMRVTVGSIGGYRATTYRHDAGSAELSWTVTVIEALQVPERRLVMSLDVGDVRVLLAGLQLFQAASGGILRLLGGRGPGRGATSVRVRELVAGFELWLLENG